MTLPLKWEFPRGKLEMGENEETCIQRKIREEINIEIEIIKKLTHNIHDYGEFQVNLIPFMARHISGDILLTEHKAYKLVHPTKLKNLDWAEADLPIVEEIVKIGFMNQGLYEELATKLITFKLSELDKQTFQVKKKRL